jgi:hypothetical protein
MPRGRFWTDTEKSISCSDRRIGRETGTIRCGYEQVSLSVQKANYAAKMYRKLGFAAVRENEEEYIMAADLQ